MPAYCRSNSLITLINLVVCPQGRGCFTALHHWNINPLTQGFSLRIQIHHACRVVWLNSRCKLRFKSNNFFFKSFQFSPDFQNFFISNEKCSLLTKLNYCNQLILPNILSLKWFLTPVGVPYRIPQLTLFAHHVWSHQIHSHVIANKSHYFR